MMVASLPKGRPVFLPETGHGTLAFSRCAKDIGAAFLLPDGIWSKRS
jgi:hypothetical protein